MIISSKKSIKESYPIVDIMKFFLCICVIALHSNATNFLPKNIQYFIQKLIFRVAVPYFFIASGFFLGRKLKNGGCSSWQTIKSYCLRLLKPFIVFSIINIVQHFITGGNNYGLLLLEIIQHVIFYPYGALWYIQASIIGALLLYPFIKKNRILLALIIGVVLYIFALLCNNYYFIVNDTIFGEFINSYLSICVTGRNGLFVGFFFLTLGIACEKFYSKTDISKHKILILFISFFLLYFVECFLIWKFALNLIKDDGALYITHILVIPALFLVTIFFGKDKTIQNTRLFRNLSTGMYFLHRPILWCFSVFFELLNRIFKSSTLQTIIIFLKQGYILFILTIIVCGGICLISYRCKKEPFCSLLK